MRHSKGQACFEGRGENNKNMSTFLKLNLSDVSKGLVVAVIVAILGILQQMFTEHGLAFAMFDWAGILDVAWKAAVAYLGKNLLSDQNGRVLGRIG